jgi:RNA polymerase sigma-70 factor (ECF subfamily)
VSAELDGAAAAAERLAGRVLEKVFREEWGRIVATLIRSTGDWDLAEECAGDAVARALDRWPVEGVPERPGAWLTTVARRRAVDRLRRAGAERNKLASLARSDGVDTGSSGPEAALPTGAPGAQAGEARSRAAGDDAAGFGDDRLRLIFTCCHPALAIDARVALTLRTLTGLTVAEIARAFLVPEATMAKRLVRAKEKIRRAGIPYRVPPPHLLAERTGGVLAVVYLLFNEGYGASRGESLLRNSLSEEAIRLGRLVSRLLPGEAEAGGLLALMLLQHSRHRARIDAAGDLVTLEDQDRSLWDAAAIEEALALLAVAAGVHRAGPYRLQAEIAACHARARDAASTDWPAIADLYRRLGRLQPSPVIELNRAVAVAMVDGPAGGLRLLDALDADRRLEGYYLLHATRADLLRRMGLAERAACSYRRALALAPTGPERRYLERRLREVGSS